MKPKKEKKETWSAKRSEVKRVLEEPHTTLIQEVLSVIQDRRKALIPPELIPQWQIKEGQKPLYYVHYAAKGSDDWQLARQYRITADRVSRILNDDPTVLDEILGNVTINPNPAIEWQVGHFQDAQALHLGMRPNATRKEVGLCVHSTYLWLAADVDDLVYDPVDVAERTFVVRDPTQGKVEVKERFPPEQTRVGYGRSNLGYGCALYKAPYSQRIPQTVHPQHSLEGKTLMEVVKRDWCDCVYWAPTKNAYSTLPRAEVEFKKDIFPKLEEYYLKKICPEMLKRGINPSSQFTVNLTVFMPVYEQS